uniref:cation transporting ATPase C-terminal domain-containing protein n=2 Tax=unclassified Picosynechococcus TaxID=3079910 RepID=UPI0030DDA27A
RSLLRYISGQTKTIIQAPLLLVGIAVAVALQVAFSQWGLMNQLFQTAPLTWQQGLICVLPMLPMIPTAIAANYLDT